MHNCNQTEKPRVALPLLATDEPICEAGKLACSADECIEQEKFCDGVNDCSDGQDENVCTPDKVRIAINTSVIQLDAHLGTALG